MLFLILALNRNIGALVRVMIKSIAQVEGHMEEWKWEENMESQIFSHKMIWYEKTHELGKDILEAQVIILIS